MTTHLHPLTAVNRQVAVFIWIWRKNRPFQGGNHPKTSNKWIQRKRIDWDVLWCKQQESDIWVCPKMGYVYTLYILTPLLPLNIAMSLEKSWWTYRLGPTTFWDKPGIGGNLRVGKHKSSSWSTLAKIELCGIHMLFNILFVCGPAGPVIGWLGMMLSDISMSVRLGVAP